MFLQWRNEEDYAKNVSIVTLAMAGLTIIMIDHKSKSRQKRLAAALTQGFWKFIPKQVNDIKQKKLTWMKLFLGGLMIACTVMTITVRYLKVIRAVAISATVLIGWVTFLYYALLEVDESSSSKRKKTNTPEEESTGWKRKLRESSDLSDRRLPVTIVTGFLGSGKTTLVKKVLDNTVGIKVLVIENEIGTEGIDHELLLQHTDKEEIILMNNGCVCCTVRKDLIKTFHTMFDDDSFSQLDWILIETTGLADPGPLIQTLYMDQKCSAYLRLDSVLTVVDAKHLPLHLNTKNKEQNNDKNENKNKNISNKNNENIILSKDKTVFMNNTKINDKKVEILGNGVHGGIPEAIRQITFSDRILLNKIDLVTEEDLLHIKVAVRTYNPSAQIICCKYSNVPVEDILNIRAFDPSRNVALITGTENISIENKSDSDNIDDDVNDNSNNSHDNNSNDNDNNNHNSNDNNNNNDDNNNNNDNYNNNNNNDKNNDDGNNNNNNDNNYNDNNNDDDSNNYYNTKKIDADSDGNQIINKSNNDNSKEIESMNKNDKTKRKIEKPINVAQTGFIQYDKNGKILPSNIRIRRENSETQSIENTDPNAVSTVSLVTDKSLDLDMFNIWVSSLLRINGANIYRLKGILNMNGYDNQFVVQGVHMIFDGQMGPKWVDSKTPTQQKKNEKNKKIENSNIGEIKKNGNLKKNEIVENNLFVKTVGRKSRLVLIGVGLNSRVLRAGFLSCEYQEDDDKE